MQLIAGTYSINYNHDFLTKNLNADLTNPNVYNSLEGLKEEHVYDEIKHKEGYKDPGKFKEVMPLTNWFLSLFSFSMKFQYGIQVKEYYKKLFPDGKSIWIVVVPFKFVFNFVVLFSFVCLFCTSLLKICHNILKKAVWSENINPCYIVVHQY